MMKFAPLALALVPAGAQAQMGGPGVDCRGLAETQFTSRPMEAGRYPYQMTTAHRSTGSRRYSFAAPGSRGTVKLTAETLRTDTRLRCFPP